METTITLKPSEFNESMFEMLRTLAAKKGFNNITISLSKKKSVDVLRKETAKQAKARIEKAIAGIENGSANFISFTAEEFESLSKK
jgi:hypothetical protein